MTKTQPNSRYHTPSSLDELTEQNVRSVAELERAAKSKHSQTDRIAAAITRFCGSMAFVWVHVVWFVTWIVANTAFAFKWDPYPFTFLTMVVSLEAIFLSTFIMIAENRQEKMDERRNHLDLQINLLAEQENTKALQLLKEMAEKMGINPDKDPSVGILEQATRPEKVIEQIDRSAEETDKQ